MEPKYYTPAIEDIRVGYEFEYNGHYTHTKSEWQKQVVQPEWYSMNYESSWDSDPTITFYMGMLRSHPENFRVPYLTKEQIEAEGWEHHCSVDGMNASVVTLTRNISGVIWEVTLFYDGAIIFSTGHEIHKGSDLLIMYQGKCPSINEFRKLCKWLGI